MVQDTEPRLKAEPQGRPLPKDPPGRGKRPSKGEAVSRKGRLQSPGVALQGGKCQVGSDGESPSAVTGR